MRIRTIKPAFWTNEKMARLPDFARLLAIGLLNYADDHGYFWANPLLVRGALFPFEEDSTKVLKGLSQLASEGFIRLGKTPDGRDCGVVVNFTTHQRVDKPQKSEIQPLATFEEGSKKVPRMVQDQSALERKGKEGNGKDISPPADAGATEAGEPELEFPVPPVAAPPAPAEPPPPEPETPPKPAISAETIYDAYPRKEGRQDALKAIAKAIKHHPPAKLLERTRAYAAAVAEWPPEDNPRFIPHPATWFNGGRYDDDPSTWERRASPHAKATSYA